MDNNNPILEESAWNKPGGTLSDKSARNELGITQEEIEYGIKEHKLQYRINNMHGNSYFKLIRREVENFIIEKYSKDYLDFKLFTHQLNQLNKEIKKVGKS